jgi:hypothetical protein
LFEAVGHFGIVERRAVDGRGVRNPDFAPGRRRLFFASPYLFEKIRKIFRMDIRNK